MQPNLFGKTLQYVYKIQISKQIAFFFSKFKKEFLYPLVFQAEMESVFMYTFALELLV